MARDFTGGYGACGHFLGCGSRFTAGARRDCEGHSSLLLGALLLRIQKVAQRIHRSIEMVIEELAQRQPPQLVAFNRRLIAKSAALLAA